MKTISWLTIVQQHNDLVRRWFICCCVLMSSLLWGQQVDEDQVSVVKLWRDLNGENSLYIKVGATCNNYDSKGIFAKDGYESIISIELINEENKVSVNYGERLPDNQMLMFYDEGIWFEEHDDIQAVFIPVFYCRPYFGSQMPLTYIVLYNGKRYMYHFDYYCQSDILGTCSLPYSKGRLQKRLSDLPKELAKKFANYLTKVYTQREDLFPNHLIFRTEKYNNVYRPYDLATAYHASYPYVLLDKVNGYLEEKKYSLATTYLNEFEYIYVREELTVNVAGFYVQDKTIGQKATSYRSRVHAEREKLLEEAKFLTRRNQYQEAYLIYKVILEEENDFLPSGN
ncbi:hypothetical protein ACPDHQ_02140 [Myroides odoratimimus]|uniref:hypothetical protein n=1 Tax=Myroides odoratimimus TaxID=76832 RepID=UPI0025785B42|nr:hypothetical protein [Myroides odoratimimus]MDM1450331.1 hypothetical protein [Myroides odoratimimus]